MEKSKVYYIGSSNGAIKVEVEENLKTAQKTEDIDIGLGVGTEEVSKVGETLDYAAAKFDEVSIQINTIAHNIYNSILEKDFSPNEVEIEFGIKIGGEAGVFVAKSTLDANLQVKLKWVKP